MIPTRRAALAQSGNRFSDKIMLKKVGNIGGIWPFCSYADESHTCHFLRVACISRFRAGAGAADTVDARAANRAARAGSAAKLRADGEKCPSSERFVANAFTVGEVSG